MDLEKYNKMCKEVAEITTIFRGKEFRNKAMGLRTYAKLAKNTTLEADAWEMRVRSERRIGELMNGGQDRASHGGDRKSRVSAKPLIPPTLKQLEIGKSLADRARRLAEMEYKEFTLYVMDGRANVLHAIERSLKKHEIDIGQFDLEAEKLGKFVVIYADPPWQYEHPPMGASNRSIERHYPTMELDDICKLPVNDIAYKDSVIFMWATSPKLPECMKVLGAWGFQYRTNMAWVKDKIGMGYYAREQHEQLLIAKLGELPPPPPEVRPSSVLVSPRLGHSVKPPAYYGIIDSMYPEVRKIELFGRPTDKRPKHWSVWGNEATGLGP